MPARRTRPPPLTAALQPIRTLMDPPPLLCFGREGGAAPPSPTTASLTAQWLMDAALADGRGVG